MACARQGQSVMATKCCRSRLTWSCTFVCACAAWGVPSHVVGTWRVYLCSWRETIVGSVSERRLSQIYSRLKSEDDMFALFLVRERALAADSKWAPYIRVLPRHLPLPLFYSNTELKALQVGLLRV